MPEMQPHLVHIKSQSKRLSAESVAFKSVQRCLFMHFDDSLNFVIAHFETVLPWKPHLIQGSFRYSLDEISLFVYQLFNFPHFNFNWPFSQLKLHVNLSCIQLQLSVVLHLAILLEIIYIRCGVCIHSLPFVQLEML